MASALGRRLSRDAHDRYLHLLGKKNCLAEDVVVSLRARLIRMQGVAVAGQRADGEPCIGDFLPVGRCAALPVDHLVKIVEMRAAGPRTGSKLDRLDVVQ